MPDWILGFLSALALAIIGWVLTSVQRRASRRNEQREAVAALRFELQSNLAWLDDILLTLNYLRDDAWNILKNKGYISYLRKPIPMNVIKVYEQLHRLNERIHVLREKDTNGTAADSQAGDYKTELVESMRTLIKLLDDEFPKIRKNFQEM